MTADADEAGTSRLTLARGSRARGPARRAPAFHQPQVRPDHNPPVARFTFAIALHAAYIASFFAVTDGLRLSTPVRNVAAGAMVLLALAAVPSQWARRAVIWQPPSASPSHAVGAGPVEPTMTPSEPTT